MVLIFSPNGVNFFPLGLNFCLRGVRWPGGWWVPGWACGLLGGRSLMVLIFSPNGVNFFPICCLSPPGVIFFPNGWMVRWPPGQAGRWLGGRASAGGWVPGGWAASGCPGAWLAGWPEIARTCCQVVGRVACPCRWQVARWSLATRPGVQVARCSSRGVNFFPHGVNFFPHGVKFFLHGVKFFPHGVFLFPHGVNFFPHGVIFSPVVLFFSPTVLIFSPTMVLVFSPMVLIFSPMVFIFSPMVFIFSPMVFFLSPMVFFLPQRAANAVRRMPGQPGDWAASGCPGAWEVAIFPRRVLIFPPMVGWSVAGWVHGVPGGWSPMVSNFPSNGVNFFPLARNFCLRGVR